jgi:hypothetical protein
MDFCPLGHELVSRMSMSVAPVEHEEKEGCCDNVDVDEEDDEDEDEDDDDEEGDARED